jgi:hypothetical protein
MPEAFRTQDRGHLLGDQERQDAAAQQADGQQEGVLGDAARGGGRHAVSWPEGRGRRRGKAIMAPPAARG